MKSKSITFKSYNPYEFLHPNLRVVSWETLDLIKSLRLQGYEVIVDPNNGKKLNYLVQKGWYEKLSDPIFLAVVNIPISFLTSYLASWVYEYRKNKQALNEEANEKVIDFIIEYTEKGRKLRFNHKGEEISDEKFKHILKVISDKIESFAKSQKNYREVRFHPIPIYLEHTDRVVGWADKYSIDETGVKLDCILIKDDETYERIEKGELKGLSVGGIVTKSTCQICKKDYVDCNHITGFSYGKKICTNGIDKILLVEMSIVKTPIQPLALIQIIRNL